MGIIKFEVDIPNFEKELSISITLRRDGEVYYSTSSPSAGNTNLNNSNNSSQQIIEGVDVQDKSKRKKKTEEIITNPELPPITSPVRKPKGGNFMGMDF